VSNVRILVTGATGYVGSRLVAALLGDGHGVVAATRNPARLTKFGWHRDVDAVGQPAVDLVNLMPRPVAAVLRTGIDLLSEFTPNGKSA
jgi:uncharacterized protein YbjT (DUF2867 family)